MNIGILENGELRIDQIDEFAAMLFRELPGIASSGGELADERIYQTPTGGKDEELDSDWRDMVEPELRELFASALDLVVEDMAGLASDEESGLHLTIPSSHSEAWLHTLNRARLVLGTEWDVTEDDMDSGYSVTTGDPERTMAILKIDFYGMLLEFFVRLRWEE